MRNQLVLVALLAVALVPAASAQPVEPQEPYCYYVYNELTPPPVAVTLVNSCTVEVEVTTGTGGCLERYQEVDLGAVFVQSRDTCHYLVRVGPELPELKAADSRCPDVYTEYEVGPVHYVSPNGCTRYVYVAGKQVYPVSVGTSGPACYDIYNEWTAGPATVIQRDSCTYEAYVGDQQVLPVTVGAAGPSIEPPPCYYVYREYNVGPVTVIQRSSCSVPEVRVDGVAVATGGPGPQCMPMYQEHEVGPVKVVRRNSCSAEAYLFGEPLLR